jgi:hypothetical protein
VNAPHLGWLTWGAMLLVLAAAAILSFAALADLAELCGVDPLLAPLLPIAIDAGAAVSTRVWLDGRAVAAERYARTMTFALLASTVAGNALHGGLVASGIKPAWWVAVGVTAIPPAVVGAVVHLAVLVGRPVEPAKVRATSATAPAGSPAGNASIDALLTSPATDDQSPPGGSPAVDHPDDRGMTPVVDRAVLAELAADGAGRRKAAKVLGTTEYRAGQLLAAARNGHRTTRAGES